LKWFFQFPSTCPLQRGTTLRIEILKYYFFKLAILFFLPLPLQRGTTLRIEILKYYFFKLAILFFLPLPLQRGISLTYDNSIISGINSSYSKQMYCYKNNFNS
jgi:hypothetical protein